MPQKVRQRNIPGPSFMMVFFLNITKYNDEQWWCHSGRAATRTAFRFQAVWFASIEDTGCTLTTGSNGIERDTCTCKDVRPIENFSGDRNRMPSALPVFNSSGHRSRRTSNQYGKEQEPRAINKEEGAIRQEKGPASKQNCWHSADKAKTDLPKLRIRFLECRPAKYSFSLSKINSAC